MPAARRDGTSDLSGGVCQVFDARRKDVSQETGVGNSACNLLAIGEMGTM